jgi:hypothetical protein
MTTTQVGTLEEIIHLALTEEMELLGALVADGPIWELQGFYERLGVVALEAGLITPEGRVTEEGYALAASYEEQPTAEKDQRLIVGADEPVPGPFATPNVNA